MLQTPFPFLPDQAVVISKHCALVRQDGQIAVLNAAGVFFCIREHDRQGRRTALGMLSTHHLASVTELAAAFAVSRGTVYRCKEAYRAGGVDALKATRTSKGGYKLNGDTLVEVQALLDRGRSLRAAAQAVGLTHTTVSRALEQGRLRAPNRPVPEPHGSGSRPSARSAGDALCAGGIGVKRTQERVRASTHRSVGRSTAALRSGRDSGRRRGVAGAAGTAATGAARRDRRALWPSEQRLLRAAQRAANLGVHGAVADHEPRATQGPCPGRTGIAAGPGPRAGGQDGAPQAARNRRAQALAHAGRRLCPTLGPG